MIKRLFRLAESRKYYACVLIYLCYTGLIFLLATNILGFPVRIFTNKSTSMTPTLSEGMLIAVKQESSYSVGDIISFYAEIDNKMEIITHRIVQIGGNTYVTKGDANAVADDPVRPRLVIGKVILIIPYLGYLANFVKTVPGNFLFILLPALIIITIEVLKILRFVRRPRS
ncbi:signal peptidase I [Candidatus Roizmanbacteria bacterium]|nr:signal peptidase I [Candidatus Roizmanbacteria bacterium]